MTTNKPLELSELLQATVSKTAIIHTQTPYLHMYHYCLISIALTALSIPCLKKNKKLPYFSNHLEHGLRSRSATART